MPASRRHHRALAVFVHGLGVLAAVPALPAATSPRAEAAPAVVAPAPAPAAAMSPAPSTATSPAPATATSPAPVTATGPTPSTATSPTPDATGRLAPVAAPGAREAPAAPGVAATGAVIPVTPAVPAPGMGATAAPGAPRPAPPVTVSVTAAGTPAPGYRIRVHNDATTTIETTVRQELPAGSSTTAVSAGGRATRVPGPNSTGEVTWRLRLPARSTTTLDTALAVTAPGRALTAPACAFTGDGNRPYDCATATWQGTAVPAAEAEEAAPAWRRPPILAATLVVLLVLSAVGVWMWRRARRRHVEPTGAASAAAGVPPYAGGPDAPGGTVYPRPAAPGAPGRRRRPPVWAIVGVAVVVLAVVVSTAVFTATRRVSAIDTAKQPTSGAWVGRSATGTVGVPLREQSFEFTVYRVDCASAAGSARRCQATVGVRNVTPEQQTWHGELQRAYLRGGNWVTTDADATRVANLGRDVFAQPVAANSRVVLPLVFTMTGTQKPEQLELRSGVFSAGVRVDVP
ncbi:hypothetical protein [Micromonospora coxensis]|uniref:DUF4352 domain-containing protein n=1 Tax=Micromonospora coxensis TaxID=356852 RepID=A0A1C5JFX9_9ACTN|nr:hypothetical protein [Micromonospora coxensis]SCG69460.1 hypothetical protein GA0070614_4546 [Micromonospora coxensis]